MMAMKSSHAAAFALVGWYLMTPPPTKVPTLGWSVHPDWPLSDWHHVGSYDTAAECENARNTLSAKGYKLIGRTAKTRFVDDAAVGQQYAAAEYIATDDPRFKEK